MNNPERIPERFSNEYKIISFEKVKEERDEAIRVIIKIYDFHFENPEDEKRIKKMIDDLSDRIFVRELYQRKNYEK